MMMMMSEKDETSKAKVPDETMAADDDKLNINQSGKRGRQVSPDHPNSESPRKMRKKSPQITGSSKLKENVKLDSATTSDSVPCKNHSNFCEVDDKDKNFDFENDSELLNDLLEDFAQDDEASGSGTGLSKECSIGIQGATPKHTTPNEKKCSKVTDSEEILSSEFDGDFDDFFNVTVQEDEDKITEGGIDFQEFKCCNIVEIDREQQFTRVKVKQLSEKQTATVLCYGFWRETRIAVNDVVSIKAVNKSEKWTVDNNNGFLVTQPHTLISGTSVVGANFCLRRGVLIESFRGLDDLPNVEPGDSSMTIGTLVHELLQKVLKRKLSTLVDIRKVVDEVINTRRGIQMLYESNISTRECKQKMEAYVPKIFDFVKRYVIGNADRTQDKNFSGKIERIREIEENVWVPELGLKGKIDVTVDVTVNANRRVMPLEVKTGQPSFSADHRGQLMLYNMMLGFLGHQVDAGILLYIRDNIVKEIKNNRPEERDLILLRNSFAYYISKQPVLEKITKEDGSVERVWKNMELPEPINHRMACSKCPYNTLCSVYAEKDSDLDLCESHILKEIKHDTMTFLTPEHIDYVLNWILMTKLEDSTNDTTSLKDIWVMDPREREKKGSCISNLRVCGRIVEEGNKYLHTFVRKNADDNFSDSNLSRTTFMESDYIIVSTNTRINVSAGYVKNKCGTKIEMQLDRNIVKQNPMATFHLDKYPFAGLAKLNLANIGCLLNNNEITNKLRSIIIDKQPATFVTKLPRSVAEICAPLLHRLNKYQRQAILKVLTAKDYLLIRGMPGTGKTQTLIALIEILVKIGRSVLITAHTHSAVDNILLKLDDRGVEFLRLGSTKRTNPKLKHNSEDVLTANCTTVESLDAVYSSKNVVGVTCYGANHGLLSKRIFDVCLVDESTQVMQSTVLKPIFSAKTFVLVGDPEQLPPVVRNHDARKLGMDESLFSRLDSENNTVTLKLQYRMNRKIMSIANAMTYKGAMKAATEEIASATLRLIDTMVLESCERWISRALSPNLEDSIVMLNTGQTYALTNKFVREDHFNAVHKPVYNVLEGTIIMRLVAVLLKGGMESKSIGIICPYVAQVELLRRMCQEDIEINTVDQYQGRDKDVILYSGTRSEPTSSYVPTEYDVLQDRQRLNVAVTRAKHKLIIISDKITLDRYTPFQKLFATIKDDIINLEPGRDNFSWESLVPFIT